MSHPQRRTPVKTHWHGIPFWDMEFRLLRSLASPRNGKPERTRRGACVEMGRRFCFGPHPERQNPEQHIPLVEETV